MLQSLPDKFVPLSATVVGQAAQVLSVVRDRERVSIAELFIELRTRLDHFTFDHLVATLDFLYAASLVETDLDLGRVAPK